MITKNLLILAALYTAALCFLFAIEYFHKKKTIAEIKENARWIVIKVTILFLFIIITSFIFAKLGIKPK